LQFTSEEAGATIDRYHEQDAVGDDRLRPRCSHMANWTKHARRIWFWPFAPVCENMTSSTKPEVHNIAFTLVENRPTATGNVYLVTFGRVV